MSGVARKVTAEPDKPGTSEEAKKRPRACRRKYPHDEPTNSTEESTPLKVPRLKVTKKEVVDEQETSAMSTETHEPLLAGTEVSGSRLASGMSLVGDESHAGQVTRLEQKPRARRSARLAKDTPGTSALSLNDGSADVLKELSAASERIAKLREELDAANKERVELKTSNDQKDVEIAGLEKRVENLSTTNDVLRAVQITKSREAIDLKQQLGSVLAENAQLKTSADEVLNLKEELRKLKEEGGSEAKTRALRAELKKAKADLDMEMKEAAECAKQAETAKKKAKSLEAKVKELTTTIASQRDQIAEQAEELQRQSMIIRNRVPPPRERICSNCDRAKQTISDVFEEEEVAIIAEKPAPEPSRVKRSPHPPPLQAPLPTPLPRAPQPPSVHTDELTTDALVAAMLGGIPRRSRDHQPLEPLKETEQPRNRPNSQIGPLQAAIVRTPLPPTSGNTPHSVAVHALANRLYQRVGSDIAVRVIRPLGATEAPVSKPSVPTDVALAVQCKDIIGKILKVNTKYGVPFDVLHATLVRKHPEQTGMIDAVVQAAKAAMSQRRNRPTPPHNEHAAVH
ncbi:hypothetical protein AAVH_17248 [Aphelenchoides avenae]|nr:hypothetical protein AAVH_17248 [Aphelenchus avenae]